MTSSAALDNANPYASPLSPDGSGGRKPVQQPESLLAAVVQGLRIGLKWTTLIIGPLALLSLLLGLGIIVFRLLFVEGGALFSDPDFRWEMLGTLASPFGFYLASCLWGIVIGILANSAAYFVRKVGNRTTGRRQGDDSQ